MVVVWDGCMSGVVVVLCGIFWGCCVILWESGVVWLLWQNAHELFVVLVVLSVSIWVGVVILLLYCLSW